MVSSPDPSSRVAVVVTCDKCGRESTVPFTPTPGRPVYCRDCFVKQPAPPMGARGPPGRGPGGGGFRGAAPPPRANVPRKRMLAQGRKGHFVHDVMEVLTRSGRMEEAQRRMFVEMLFTRGARQSTDAAIDFLEEKTRDETLLQEELDRIGRLVEKYSFWR